LTRAAGADRSGTTNRTRPRYLSEYYERTGTCFRIFAQPRFVRFFRTPVPIYLPAPAGTIGAGPSDRDIVTVDALDKRPYYDDPADTERFPPYRGPRGKPARPRGGHFAYLQPSGATARQFSAAQVYATIRFTVTVWEHYLGRRVRWYFRRRFPRLEVIPRTRSGTAYSRPGYIECGYERGRTRQRRYPLGENFDVVAHETGHLIQRSIIGHPDHVEGLEQRAREEAFADLVAIVALLHVRPAVARLLDRTRGNLFSANLLSRIGEMSQTIVARRANNAKTMTTLEWDPDPRAFRYELSAPFTGGGYDALVDLYESILVRRRAIPHALAEASFEGSAKKLPGIQRAFDVTYRARRTVFEDALLEARDVFAGVLANTWRRMSPYDGFPEALAAMLAVAGERHGPRVQRIFRAAFAWRGIEPGTSP
jgi:hypothetical protein